MNNRVLLHICCGICAIGAIERLQQDGYDVTGFFYNPNIHPEEEYLRRKEVLEKIKEVTGITIIEGDYDPEHWYSLCQPYHSEPEGGQRCPVCFRMRLEETKKLCACESFNFFTTTLTISPHKPSELIIAMGKEIGGEEFLPYDFKKKDGFKRAVTQAKHHQLYRQNYCGCEYSKR